MFSKFLALFNSESLLDRAFETTIQMLEFDYQMYVDARRSLREQDEPDLSYDIKDADRRVNKFEREVRRNVLSHLAVSSRPELVPGLALVTIVIDVERIGDYTKNIVELAHDYDGRLSGGPYEDVVVRIESYIKEQFPAVIGILKSQDSEGASEALQQEPTIAGESDRVIREIIGGGSNLLDSRHAVCLAMYVRYLKRINAHLTNVASSVVNPFPRIGFREKKPKTT